MPAGRRPKSDAEKRRTGNPGRRRLGPRPAPEPSGSAPSNEAPKPEIPKPPEHLDAPAVEAWNLLAEHLIRTGAMRPQFTLALALLCEAWSRYVRHSKLVAEFGDHVQNEKTGRIYPNPSAKAQREAWADVRAMLNDFGLTPATLSRAGAADVTPPDRAFEQFVAGRGKVS